MGTDSKTADFLKYYFIIKWMDAYKSTLHTTALHQCKIILSLKQNVQSSIYLTDILLKISPLSRHVNQLNNLKCCHND